MDAHKQKREEIERLRKQSVGAKWFSITIVGMIFVGVVVLFGGMIFLKNLQQKHLMTFNGSMVVLGAATLALSCVGVWLSSKFMPAANAAARIEQLQRDIENTTVQVLMCNWVVAGKTIAKAYVLKSDFQNATKFWVIGNAFICRYYLLYIDRDLSGFDIQPTGTLADAAEFQKSEGVTFKYSEEILVPFIGGGLVPLAVQKFIVRIVSSADLGIWLAGGKGI